MEPELYETTKNDDGTYTTKWVTVRTDPFGTVYKDLSVHIRPKEEIQQEIDDTLARIASYEQVIAKLNTEIDAINKLG